MAQQYKIKIINKELNEDMMKLICILLILLLVPLNISFPNENINKLRLVEGFWTPFFPVMSTAFGYIFCKDGTFYYYDESDYNIMNKNSGSLGRWKINNNKILILIEKDLLWEKEWIKDKNGFYDPGQNNICRFIFHKNGEWVSIGDLRIYTEEKSYKDRNDSFVKPANIFFKPIINREVVPSYRAFWKICGDNSKCNSAIEIIKYINELKIKSLK